MGQKERRTCWGARYGAPFLLFYRASPRVACHRPTVWNRTTWNHIMERDKQHSMVETPFSYRSDGHIRPSGPRACGGGGHRAGSRRGHRGEWQHGRNPVHAHEGDFRE